MTVRSSARSVDHSHGEPKTLRHPQRRMEGQVITPDESADRVGTQARQERVASVGVAMRVPASLREYLVAREPVFDRPEIIWDENSFDAETAPDFFEIGASGQRYDREYIKTVVLGRIAGTHPPSLADGYRITDLDVRLLTHGLAQVLYTLRTAGRTTIRSTLYRESSGHWQAIFHQGTVEQAADHPAPSHTSLPPDGNSAIPES